MKIEILKLFSEEDYLVIAKRLAEVLKKELQPTSNATTEDEIWEINKLSEKIGLTKSTIYGHVHRNTIPFIKKGKMLRFSKIDIVKWLEEGKSKSKSDLEAKANEYLAKKPLFNR